MQKLPDAEGLVSKADCVKIRQDMKLLDFGGVMGEKRKHQTSRKERRNHGGEEEEGGNVGLSLIRIYF